MNSGVKPELHKSQWQKTIDFGQADFLPQDSQRNNFPTTIYGSVNGVISVLYVRVWAAQSYPVLSWCQNALQTHSCWVACYRLFVSFPSIVFLLSPFHCYDFKDCGELRPSAQKANVVRKLCFKEIECSLVQKTLMCPILKILARTAKGIFQYILACSGCLTLISSRESKYQTQMMKV